MPLLSHRYELTTAHLSFQQRSYANCQVCHRTMYSWSSRTVPCFALVNPAEGNRHSMQTAATSRPRQEGLYELIGRRRRHQIIGRDFIALAVLAGSPLAWSAVSRLLLRSERWHRSRPDQHFGRASLQRGKFGCSPSVQGHSLQVDVAPTSTPPPTAEVSLHHGKCRNGP